MSRTSERIVTYATFAAVLAVIVWWLSREPGASPSVADPAETVELVTEREDPSGDSGEVVEVRDADIPERPADGRPLGEPTESAVGLVQFMPPGELEPGSGDGVLDQLNYAPAMRFPVEQAPAFANSQVYRPGGFLGPAGGQCDAVNYAYAWWDNFCETRGHTTPMCPAGRGHQGQDIRPASCQKNVHWAVAAEDGTITSIGSYSVRLMTDGGVRYTYLHLQRSTLAVGEGDRVRRGQRIGLISNEFGGTPTTTHLHFEIRLAVDAGGVVLNTHVPPYVALVDSYGRLLAGGA